MKFIAVILVLWTLINADVGARPTTSTHRAKTRVLRGPAGTMARFTNGVIVAYSGGEDTLFARVEVLRPGRKPVVIHLDAGIRIDGDDAASRNVATKSVDGSSSRGWSLDLWSCDGHYIVLMSVTNLENSHWDFRNSLLYAYDTTTGQYVEFRSPTSLLSTDTFVHWSATDGGVAILRGREKNEEGEPAK